MLSKDIYVVEGFRTPFCKFGTDLANEQVAHLGIVPSKAVFTSSGIDPADVDEVVFGCCNQTPTMMGNVSRTIAVRSGVPVSVPAVTVHRNCASGFEAITYACDKAAAGKGNIFLVGGVENMSQAPLTFSQEAANKFIGLAKSRTIARKLSQLLQFRPSDFRPQVSLKLGMVDPLCNLNMGQTAELLAREYNISRKQQDEYAETSHFKALAAHACGAFDREIVPFNRTEDNCIRSYSNKTIDKDNGPRNDAWADKLGRLRPVFDRQGTVTAGNASQVTDGGAAILLMTQEGLDRTGATPIGRIIDYAYTGCDPSRMGLGPVSAMKKVCESTGLTIQDADLIEINEAFAVQVLAVLQECQGTIGAIPKAKLNTRGGAIALGHPLAVTGARLILGLVKELRHQRLSKGLASLCVGGGQGGALWVEAL